MISLSWYIAVGNIPTNTPLFGCSPYIGIWCGHPRISITSCSTCTGKWIRRCVYGLSGTDFMCSVQVDDLACRGDSMSGSTERKKALSIGSVACLIFNSSFSYGCNTREYVHIVDIGMIIRIILKVTPDRSHVFRWLSTQPNILICETGVVRRMIHILFIKDILAYHGAVTGYLLH